MRFRLRTLLIAVTLLVPLNCASLVFVAAAVESPTLDIQVARSIFALTVVASLIALSAVLAMPRGGGPEQPQDR